MSDVTNVPKTEVLSQLPAKLVLLPWCHGSITDNQGQSRLKAMSTAKSSDPGVNAACIHSL